MEKLEKFKSCCSGGVVVEATCCVPFWVVSSPYFSVNTSHSPWRDTWAGHVSGVTWHVSGGTPAPTFLPLPILSISCEVEDSFLTADMAAGSESSTRASLALSCRGSDTEILDWLVAGCCPLVARVTAMDQLPGLLSWSWSLYTRHEVSTSTLIFMATTSSRRQRGARLL